MKIRVMGLALLASGALGACGTFCLPPTLNPAKPLVAVVDGALFVTPDPLVFLPEQKSVEVVWTLSANSPYRFTDRGVVIESVNASLRQAPTGDATKPEGLVQAGGEFVCHVRKEGLEFACTNVHTKPGRYKYTLSVKGGREDVKPLDPTIMNL